MICTFTLHNHCLFGWLLNFSTIILMSKSSNKLWFEFQMKLYHRLITLSLTGRLDLEQSCLKLDLSQILFRLFKYFWYERFKNTVVNLIIRITFDMNQICFYESKVLCQKFKYNTYCQTIVKEVVIHFCGFPYAPIQMTFLM